MGCGAGISEKSDFFFKTAACTQLVGSVGTTATTTTVQPAYH